MNIDFDYNNFSVEMMDCLMSLCDEFNFYIDDDCDLYYIKHFIEKKFDRLFELYEEFEEKW